MQAAKCSRHGAGFASVSLLGSNPDVKANSINLVDEVVQRSINVQGTLSEGVDLYIPNILANRQKNLLLLSIKYFSA